MALHNDIVLFHYSLSPYAQRITWYLAFRGIDYAQCIQPPTLPREDLDALGVKYRRIPVMSIGRDIYCDSRLIIQKLEERFPDGALGATRPDEKAIERLLEKWCIDGGVFARTAQLLPTDLPLLNDPKFIKDREDFSGRSWAKAQVTSMRPEALAHMREMFDFLETGLLADGREWILKTEKPSLADIEGIWPFHWLSTIPNALPSSLFSPTQYPKVFSWISRFKKAVSQSFSATKKPTTFKGSEAIKHITQAKFVDPNTQVDENDPLGLKKGEDVEVWPIETGFNHHNKGRLVALTSREVVIETQSRVGKEVRIHFPRINFRIQPVSAAGEVAKI